MVRPRVDAKLRHGQEVAPTISGLLVALLWGCADAGLVPPDAGADARQPPPPCEAIAPTSCPGPPPRWADVQPIFATRCAVCHGNVPGHWPLDTYTHVVDWSVEIRGLVLSCEMPPPDSEFSMTLEERQLILQWLRCNAPR